MTKPERIVLEGDKAVVCGVEGGDLEADLEALAGAVNRNSVLGLEEECLPDNICWKVQAGPLTVCIVQQEPQLRRLLWIDEASQLAFGPEARYRYRRLAHPYVVFKVPFLNGRIIPRTELFYRNEPLRRLSDELYWPNLLNVSPNAYGCKAWICTQYLSKEAFANGLQSGLHALVTHLWGGGFNRSSEAHEGASGFSKAKADKLDPRVTDLDLWEQESVKDPRFILQIQWKPVGLTVRQLIENELRVHRVLRNLGSTAEWINLVLSTANGKSRKMGAD